MIEIVNPDSGTLVLHHVVLDYNGTLVADGCLLPGGETAFQKLSQHLTITVVTADTFGTAWS